MHTVLLHLSSFPISISAADVVKIELLVVIKVCASHRLLSAVYHNCFGGTNNYLMEIRIRRIPYFHLTLFIH